MVLLPSYPSTYYYTIHAQRYKNIYYHFKSCWTLFWYKFAMLPSSAARWGDAAESGPLLEKGDLCTARAKDIKNLKLLRGHGLIINYTASRPLKLRAIKSN